MAVKTLWCSVGRHNWKMSVENYLYWFQQRNKALEICPSCYERINGKKIEYTDAQIKRERL